MRAHISLIAALFLATGTASAEPYFSCAKGGAALAHIEYCEKLWKAQKRPRFNRATIEKSCRDLVKETDLDDSETQAAMDYCIASMKRTKGRRS